MIIKDGYRIAVEQLAQRGSAWAQDELARFIATERPPVDGVVLTGERVALHSVIVPEPARKPGGKPILMPHYSTGRTWPKRSSDYR